MSANLPPLQPVRPAPLIRWRRWRLAAVIALLWGLLLSIDSATPVTSWLLRTALVVGGARLAFGLLERTPHRLPPWLARWVLQLLGVVVVIPFGAFIGYGLTSPWPFWTEPLRLQGFAILCFAGVLFGPWIALAAMVRQREALAHEQALAFALERSELERRATDARLHLLQAQVQPHFLFNTLANVRALVNVGSPRAGQVLDSLIDYLRAAVPRINGSDGAGDTLAQELHLVRAYLALMHMRMPDRLRFSVQDIAAAEALQCPPMTLLTLVENAVRHGIDPAEDGGSIDVSVQLLGDRCLLRVLDTGVGLGPAGAEPGQGPVGAGTGLSTLRERLRLAHGSRAQLRLSGVMPHGVCAEIELPAVAVGA